MCRPCARSTRFPLATPLHPLDKQAVHPCTAKLTLRRQLEGSIDRTPQICEHLGLAEAGPS